MTYTVAVTTASFTATGTDTELKAHWVLSAPISYVSTLNGYLRGLLDPVTFIGAETSLNTTAPMPSHQAGDLIIVWALNTTGGLSSDLPVVPTSPAGQPQWVQATARRDETLGFALRVAYIFATQNTHVVGAWLNSNRTTVAVYRNASGLDDQTNIRLDANANFIRYRGRFNLLQRQQPMIVQLGFARGNLDASITPTGYTTRTSTSTINGAAAPGVGLHDLTVPIGTNTTSAVDVSVSTTGNTFSFNIIIEAGIPKLTAESASFSASLNGGLLENHFIPRSGVFRAEISHVLTRYIRFFQVDSGPIILSGNSAELDQIFYNQSQTGSFALASPGALFKRTLFLRTVSAPVSAGLNDIEFGFVYFLEPNPLSLSSSYSGATILKTSVIKADAMELEYTDFNAVLLRQIIELITSQAYASSAGQVGFRNDSVFPATGGTPREAILDYGGSSPSNPSFLRPENVKYNSIKKSRDFGDVNNFFATLTGEIGSEVGTSTLFFKLHTLGDANLQITKNDVNRFTDQQISIGILDSERKQVEVNDFGFAYQNEIESTPESEFADAMPRGTYYFTVSSSQWQKIPYSINIQAIRFSALEGEVLLTSTSYGRFAISKLEGPALWTGPMAATIPTAAQLKGITGPALLSSGSRGILVIPSGVAIMQMLPSGRLKNTFKISGAASLTNTNIATLTSEPPSNGGGYGP